MEILWLGTPILSWPATVLGGVHAIEAKLPTSDSVVIREIFKVQLFLAASGGGHVVHAILEGALRGRPAVRQLSLGRAIFFLGYFRSVCLALRMSGSIVVELVNSEAR